MKDPLSLEKLERSQVSNMKNKGKESRPWVGDEVTGAVE